MSIGVYLAAICLLLSLGSWFDSVFPMFRLRKSHFIMLLLSLLVLNRFMYTHPSGFDISPAVLLLYIFMFVCSLHLGEYSFFSSLISILGSVCAALGTMLMFPNAPLYAAMIPVSLCISMLFIRRPVFAAKICVSIPIVVYTVSFFAEILLYVPYTPPLASDILDAQIFSLVLAMSASYARRILHKKLRKELN
ncbi:MAG: hypothetical protein IJO93_00390 [Clostridia bacterium]|nr:hypothetical protein [Clostridia bacterium]